MIYCDTSVLVSSLTTEVATPLAQQWLRENSNEILCISPWVITEFNSALAMKLRLAIISADERANILFEFDHLRMTKLHIVEFSNTHFHTAAHFVSQHHLGLRAADALHLAITADNGATLCTLDQRLFDACKTLRIASVMP